MSDPKALEAIANKAARQLFVNGYGQEAARLVLTSANGRDLGGWSLQAVRARILSALQEANR